MENNMKLWGSVCKTNPGEAKPVEVGGRNITALDAQFQRKKATEVFGPEGIGWGIVPESEKFEFNTFGETTIASFFGVMFYKFEGEEGKIPINAAIKIAYVTSSGKGYLKVDEEYTKKVQTNALTKGLSKLGFNSDVFEGKFEDNSYIQQMKNEFSNPLEWVGARKEIKDLCSNLKLTVKDIDEAVRDNDFSDSKVLSYLKQLADARKKKEKK